MTKKQTVIIVALAVVVLGGIVVGVIIKYQGNTPAGVGTLNSISSAVSKNMTVAKPYSPEVPRGATETVPAQAIPIVNRANATPDAKFSVFHINASRNGYSPSSITVKRGDTVEINLEGEDGRYDIFSSSAGFYASAWPGNPGKISFQAGTSGAFVFNCRDLCPGGATIKGSLIVLP